MIVGDAAFVLACSLVPLFEGATDVVVYVTNAVAGWVDAARDVVAVRVLDEPGPSVGILDAAPSGATIVLVLADAPTRIDDAGDLACSVIIVFATRDGACPVALGYDA